MEEKKINVKTIIEIDGVEFDLTENEMNELSDKLDKALGKNRQVFPTYIPYPVYQNPLYPTFPEKYWWQQPVTTVTSYPFPHTDVISIL